MTAHADGELREVARECAEWICRIADDLRAAGDVRMVVLDEEGVTPAGITQADELWLVALRLDPDVAWGRVRGEPI